MPFLGQDWRSPGQTWVKTEEGWKKYSDEKNNNVTELKGCCKDEELYKENMFLAMNYDVAAKKRKKDLLNNSTKVPYFHKDKWIYVHKGSTKERHGYCTLGEAFNRLDFSSAIMDSRRFNYVVRLLELIAKSQLPSLSGVAQKNYMNILEKVVQKVLENQLNVRPIRELLQTLYVSLCSLVQDMGKSVLVGNINIWVHRMENILLWQQQLDNIQINRPASKGMTLTDLPVSLQLNIMQRLSDGRDLVSLGQVSPDLNDLAEDRLLWKKLCQYHFTERQIRKRLILTDNGHLDWKKMYFKLCRCYPRKEQYCDTLQFCTHCHILFWKLRFRRSTSALHTGSWEGAETWTVWGSLRPGWETLANLLQELYCSLVSDLELTTQSVAVSPGHKPPLHCQQHGELLHCCVPPRFHQPLQILRGGGL